MSDKYYIWPSADDCVWLNAILYSYYVTNDGVHFIPPFQEGTLNYINPDSPPYVVDDIMLNALTNENIPLADRDIINTILSAKISEQEAVDRGWIPDPTKG